LYDDQEDGMTTDALTSDEIRGVREMLDVQAIQDVMLRYVRCADRNDQDVMKTIFWEGATDDHGNYRGSAEGFFENAVANVSRSLTRYHILGPVRVDFVGDSQAKAESYFFYVGTYERDESVIYGALTGRYRDLFEKRDDEWRVLRRTVVYDTSRAFSYDPAWDFFKIPEGHNRAGFAPHDATYAAQW